MGVADRGPLFLSEQWNCVFEQPEIQLKLSTMHHTQTDRQTVKYNGKIKQNIPG